MSHEESGSRQNPQGDIFRVTWSRLLLCSHDESLKRYIVLQGDETATPAQTKRLVQVKTETTNGISFPAAEQEHFGVQVLPAIKSRKRQA